MTLTLSEEYPWSFLHLLALFNTWKIKYTSHITNKREVLGIELRAQVLYPLSHVPTLLLLVWVFFRQGLLLLPGHISNCSHPTSTSQVAGIAGMHYHTWLAFEIGSCYLCLGWTQTVILLSSTSQVAYATMSGLNLQY
jgi:hypothetical protein